MSADDDKKAAARRALEWVKPGMRLGLGTGSTAEKFVAALGDKVAQGLDVVCVPTSERTAAQAAALSIPLTTLEDTPQLDLTVDGADEVDGALRLIKGGGGALLREKIVAAASTSMLVIADGSKLVDRLGKFPLPVEVVPFGLGATRILVGRALSDCGIDGAPVILRTDTEGAPFVTDGGHYILDCACEAIPDAEALADALVAIPGVVEHGLFLGLCDTVVIGAGGETRVLTA
ncbi:ribose-5-phosphate isomerase RpiA [Futiania mangrovi]|uniref:Ribose-5-phosphate isomerase A n=1 Tax=Futiania mangrovi TaxID=2959716 RepID=A0A9J6PA14_9PROT|nr:ribose-5-phosphate isomerase RpiA [Futiania mangrovii]MCP1335837.1 ribose-5-phosphate isomerase RpiA [Futiania mangrovii]